MKIIRQTEFWVVTLFLVSYMVIYLHHGYLLIQKSELIGAPFNLVNYLFPALLKGLVLYLMWVFINFWLVPKWWLTGRYIQATAYTLACYVVTTVVLTAIYVYLSYPPNPVCNSTFIISVASWKATNLAVCFGLFAVYILLRQVALHQYCRYGLSQTRTSRMLQEAGVFTLLWLWMLMLLWGMEYYPLFGVFGIYYMAVVPFSAAVYFINLYWLIPGYQAEKLWHYIKNLVVVIALLTLPEMALAHAAAQRFPLSMLILTAWVIPLVIVLPLSWMVYSSNRQRYQMLTSVKAALDVTDAKLHLLKSQINPHFLFNTLNSLYGSALADGSVRTAIGVQQLADMMRFMLHDNQLDIISLDSEVSYLNNYLSLQGLRLSADAVTLDVELDNHDHDLQVAPMLLIPLVENAFKHGIGEPGAASYISISLQTSAERIVFEVLNSLHPEADQDPEKTKSGIGLANVSQRLEIYHKGQYQFVYGPQGDTFAARLEINTSGVVMK